MRLRLTIGALAIISLIADAIQIFVFTNQKSSDMITSSLIGLLVGAYVVIESLPICSAGLATYVGWCQVPVESQKDCVVHFQPVL